MTENPGDMSMFGFDLASNTPSSQDTLRRSNWVRQPPVASLDTRHDFLGRRARGVVKMILNI